MQQIQAFKHTLDLKEPEKYFSANLKSLWYDAKGNWDLAHAQVDQLKDPESAWVHAYLHRKEGDLWNADYLYARAKKSRPSCSLEEEWETLVSFFWRDANE